MKKPSTIRLKLKVPVRFRFIRIILCLMVIFFLLNVYISILILRKGPSLPVNELMPFFVFQLNYGGIVLIFIISIVWVLHYGFGALSRMENILEQIISGDYTFRMHLRKHDIMRPFAEKLNKVLDLLEEAKKP